MGLGVAYELLKVGRDVDIYEADRPMGGRSSGDGRIFRLAHNHPALVDWAVRARHRWREWSEAAGIQFLGNEGTVVSGEIEAMSSAMIAAQAPFEIRESMDSLPATSPVGPFLYDVHGGVINSAGTGNFLMASVKDHLVPYRVTSLTLGEGCAFITTTSGTDTTIYDSVIVAAGAGTPKLVAPLGISVPNRLVHHMRLTFPLRVSFLTPPCWIDLSRGWRQEFWSYGQLVAPGRWAIGGHFPEGDCDVSVNRALFERQVRRVLTDYVKEYITGCEPEVVDTNYCNASAGLSDGLGVANVGAVIAVWGENLFKVAPVAALALAEAALSGDIGESLSRLEPLQP